VNGIAAQQLQRLEKNNNLGKAASSILNGILGKKKKK
jgi:hypothetical protein